MRKGISAVVWIVLGIAIGVVGSVYVVVHQGAQPARETGSDGAVSTALKMNMAKYGMPAVSVGNSIYIIGGHGPDGFLNSIEKFEPAGNRISVLATHMLKRRFHSAEAVSGKIYIFGGCVESGILGIPYTDFLPTLDIYDPGTHACTHGAPMLSTRWLPASVAIDGRIYVIGGSPPELGRPDNFVQVYNVSLDTWSRCAPMPTARQCETVVYNGKIYAIGGYDGARSLSDFAEYDPKADTWTALPDMPFAMSAHHAVVIGDEVYCFGDYADPGLVACYNFTSRRWSNVRIPFLPVRHAAVVLHDTTVYVCGGNRGSAGLDYIQRFTVDELQNASRWSAAAGQSGDPMADEKMRGIMELEKKIKDFLIDTDSIVDVDVNIAWPDVADNNAKTSLTEVSISILEFKDTALGRKKLARAIKQISKMVGVPAENVYMADKDGEPLFPALYGWERFKYLCDTGLKEYVTDDADSEGVRQLGLEDANPMAFDKKFYFSDTSFIKENSLDFATLKLEHFKIGIQADLFGDTEDEYILAVSYTSPTSGTLYMYDCCLNKICFFESGCVSSMKVMPDGKGKDILEIVTKDRTGNWDPILIKKTRYGSNRSFGNKVSGCDHLYAKLIEEKEDDNTPGVPDSFKRTLSPITR